MCVLVVCPSFFVPPLSLSALSGWVHGAHLGLGQRSRQSRGTPLRRKGQHKPQGQREPSSTTPSERERGRKTPSPQRLHVPCHPHEGATCALEALGMKLRVSALWGDKSVFWFTTWTWPEFRSEKSCGILGFRRIDDLGICFAFVFRNLSNSVGIVFFVCAF